jgi:dTDP-4-amino-4,6-dideoxygalactose transaminase
VDAIHALAQEHGLRVIEDAAHAFGSRADGRAIGTFGDLVCFSFGPVKIITSLEGGALVTPHEEDVQKIKELRLLGVDIDRALRTNNACGTTTSSARAGGTT